MIPDLVVGERPRLAGRQQCRTEVGTVATVQFVTRGPSSPQYRPDDVVEFVGRVSIPSIRRRRHPQWDLHRHARRLEPARDRVGGGRDGVGLRDVVDAEHRRRDDRQRQSRRRPWTSITSPSSHRSSSSAVRSSILTILAEPTRIERGLDVLAAALPVVAAGGEQAVTEQVAEEVDLRGSLRYRSAFPASTRSTSSASV
ncbi:hypothetical protein D8S78_11085 [Natrialba swarupiae]|nr:hypothetical protein [Natrialba swarupiae]